MAAETIPYVLMDMIVLVILSLLPVLSLPCLRLPARASLIPPKVTFLTLFCF